MTDQLPPDENGTSRAQWSLVGITLALTAAVVVYRLTHRIGLSQTGAFFVGLPAELGPAGLDDLAHDCLAPLHDAFG